MESLSPNSSKANLVKSSGTIAKDSNYDFDGWAFWSKRCGDKWECKQTIMFNALNITKPPMELRIQNIHCMWTPAVCLSADFKTEENINATALLVPSYSSYKSDSHHCEGTVDVDLSLPHPVEEVTSIRGTINVVVAHDDHTEVLEVQVK
ncbi:hypothetical protein CQW23_26183 [Capsicum baccatum]|uniref:Uncharacterized protein n=1 Tax=Capsicum baccatum TaxID=33114 RepID=A0A2G2VN51_CAPBA|nr:hypothetical protein CQW23_26183 [Capsicum baccatum]